MIDLRGHGQSGPARFGFGRTERRDVRGAVDWLVARGFRPGRVGVLGISMGASATGIGAASEDDRIGALVADSSYADVSSLLAMHWEYESHLPRALSSRRRDGWGSTASAATSMRRGHLDEIGAIRKPILLIHCDEDPVTPPAHAHRLKEAAGSSADLWEPHSDRHAGAYTMDPRIYVDKVAGFFDRHLDR